MFLSLSNFRVSYPKFNVFVGSINIQDGAVTAVIGRNGSGKTSLIEGVLSVMESSGSILWTGEKRSLDKINAGVQLQKSGFGDHVLVEDICFLHKHFYKKQNYKMFKDFEMQELMKKQYQKLSRGQKQRVDLFVAMSHMPRFLFLDEPITGLDANFSDIFMKYFKSCSDEEKNSIMFCCHSPEELAIADTIIWLDRGEVKDFGNKSKMLKKYLGEYKIYFKDLTNTKRNHYSSIVKSLNFKCKEVRLEQSVFCVYGGSILKEWAEKIIVDDSIKSHGIASVTEGDFLEYINRGNIEC